MKGWLRFLLGWGTFVFLLGMWYYYSGDESPQNPFSNVSILTIALVSCALTVGVGFLLFLVDRLVKLKDQMAARRAEQRARRAEQRAYIGLEGCARCRGSANLKPYSIHLMKVVERKWDTPPLLGVTRYGKNFYVPVASVSECYCNRCSWLVWMWFHAEFVLWLALFAALVAAGIELFSMDPTMDRQITLLIFGAITLVVGGFLLREIGLRLLFALSRTEAVEFRMKQRQQRLTTGSRGYYADSGQ